MDKTEHIYDHCNQNTARAYDEGHNDGAMGKYARCGV